MTDITSWLKEHGLEKYAGAFLENELTVAILPELTEQDLRELGLPMGPRKLLLKLARELDLSDLTVQIPQASSRGASFQEAERRQLTVMFADLAESTELSQLLDAEDLRTITRTYQDAVKAVVERRGGYIARYMGDGVLAYFGFPSAGEDDAERAVLAGLDLVRTVPELVLSQPLAVRVGIATGQVVVGDLIGEGASQEAAVVGETPNLAARLQAEAAANEIVLSETTAQLVNGLIELKNSGRRQLKGFATSQPIWTAVRAADVETRFDARQSATSNTVFGRDSELSLLEQRWRMALQGEGQVVLLNGEPGIGKSRLTDEFRLSLDAHQHVALRFQCTPYHANSAFYPFIKQLQLSARSATNESADTKLDKLEQLVVYDGENRGKILSLFAALLSLPLERYPALSLAPQQRKIETIEGMCAEFELLCRRQPVLVLFEDVHWVDPTSKEVLDELIEMVQRLPAMMVITHRPEFTAWGAFGHVTELRLNRLGRKDGVSIVARMAGGKSIPAEVVDDILEKADGVPLYVEELAKAVLEGDLLTETEGEYVLNKSATSLAIPSTLRDSLMSRLDRLGEAKEIAQAAACIGREFRYEVLKEIVRAPTDNVLEALERLEAQ